MVVLNPRTVDKTGFEARLVGAIVSFVWLVQMKRKWKGEEKVQR
jgi:hypothetical protein